jgi:hypothetical protein
MVCGCGTGHGWRWAGGWPCAGPAWLPNVLFGLVWPCSASHVHCSRVVCYQHRSVIALVRPQKDAHPSPLRTHPSESEVGRVWRATRRCRAQRDHLFSPFQSCEPVRLWPAPGFPSHCAAILYACLSCTAHPRTQASVIPRSLLNSQSIRLPLAPPTHAECGRVRHAAQGCQEGGAEAEGAGVQSVFALHCKQADIRHWCVPPSPPPPPPPPSPPTTSLEAVGIDDVDAPWVALACRSLHFHLLPLAELVPSPRS